MGRITAMRQIRAPLERVFAVVADIENFRQAVPEILEVEFLTESRRGVGTRFRETRQMGKRKATVELEVTEYAENRHVRLESDAGGTIWDTVFRVKQRGEGQSTLTMDMEDKAYRFLARALSPMIRPMVRKAVERDMDAVKAYCEQG